MNRATIIGNLTKDPELRTTSSGVSVCTFTVAVNRNFGERKEVDYLPVVTWRGLAENCSNFLSKGRKVGVSGRLQTRSYEGNNGEKRYVTEIVADEVDFLSPKRDTSGAAPGVDSRYRAGVHDTLNPPDESQDVYDDGDFEPLDDEQMPF